MPARHKVRHAGVLGSGKKPRPSALKKSKTANKRIRQSHSRGVNEVINEDRDSDKRRDVQLKLKRRYP